jgi:diguanylate cyclase (GGDEF)-like protein
MKRRIDSIRPKLLVAAAFAIALLSSWAIYSELRALDRGAELSHRLQSLSLVRIVKLYIEQAYPGEWRVSEGYLCRGKARLAEGLPIHRALGDYLPADAAIAFGVGEPPARPPSTDLGLPFLSVGGAVVAATGEGGKVVGWISISSGEDQRALREGRAAISALFALSGLSLLLIALLGVLALRRAAPAERSVELEGGSRRDRLTGLLNRRGIGEAIGDPLANYGLSHVAILDIDRFSAVREERGGEGCDRVLALLARAVVSIVRGADLCGRWEGDEFIVVYRSLAGEYAAASAERLRAGIEGRAFGTPKAPLRLTVTVGIAPIGGGGFEEAAAAAYRAMRDGKLQGRNRVVVAG